MAVLKVKESYVQVHGALWIIQTNFAAGAVIAKVGMPKLNPVVFALIREVAAGSSLALVAKYMHSNFGIPKKAKGDLLLTGASVFLTQILSIIGLKLATNPVDFAIWQPVQPVAVAAASIFLGWEKIVKARVIGISLAFLGCALVAYTSSKKNGDSTKASRRIAANIFFFLSCMAGVSYQLLSKPILKIYPSICVTAWCYGVASLLTIPTAFVIAASPTASAFICPDCAQHSFFFVPLTAAPALAWWIGPSTIINYALQMWAIQQTSPTLVTAYSALQPILAALLTLFLLFFFASKFDCHHHSNNCLDPPTYYHYIASCLVFAGLALVVSSEARAVLLTKPDSWQTSHTLALPVSASSQEDSHNTNGSTSAQLYPTTACYSELSPTSRRRNTAPSLSTSPPSRHNSLAYEPLAATDLDAAAIENGENQHRDWDKKSLLPALSSHQRPASPA